jgi:hypothetical protein
MAHRALLLPEVVAKILQAGREERGLLYNSLLVNRLFFQEGSRILWSVCDYYQSIHPSAHDLGTLVLREDVGLERARFYANLVREIHFNYDFVIHVDLHTWHIVFRQLQFPNLKLLCLDELSVFATEDALLQYIGPRLCTLHAVCGSLSTHFFNNLPEVCSGLQNVTLQSMEVAASESSLLRAFAKMKNLKNLYLDDGFQELCSAGMLETLATLPKLEDLSLPEIPEDSMSVFLENSNQHWFPCLKQLYMGATAETLELVHQIAPGIKAIGVFNEHLGHTDNILSALSRFRQLTQVLVRLSARSTIQDTELLQLAHGCPGLADLQIGFKGWYEIPLAIGITDDLLDDLARSLPNIHELSLIYNSDTRPGLIRTLQTLDRHCPRLEKLNMSCRSDWELLLDLPKGVSLGQFAQLIFSVNEHMLQSFTKEEYSRLLTLWQANAEVWFPQIKLFHIRGSDNWEVAFEEFVEGFASGHTDGGEDKVEAIALTSTGISSDHVED